MKKQLAALLALCIFLSGCVQQPDTPASVAAPPSAAETELPTTAQTAPPTQETEPPTPQADKPAEPARAEPKDSDFVSLEEYLPDLVTDLRYATQENFTKTVIYDFSAAYLRYGTVKKLAGVCRELEEKGLRLLVWDAFRPVSAQFRLWEVCPDPVFVADPTKGFSSHSRGNTLDVTLITLAGNDVAMPTDFDDFSSLADRNYGDCPSLAAENAQLLQDVMERHGFSGYFNEWWHFTDTQSYDVEQVFDPAAVSTWYADCEEFITLREEPSLAGKEILKIPAGQALTVLGWTGEFALADYLGHRGYVLSSYICSEDLQAGQAPQLWLPNCNEFISLRPAPGSKDTIAQIPKGEPVRLLGWSGKYARVLYEDHVGYVLANYIYPQEEGWMESSLDLLKPVDVYPYEDLMQDAASLEAAFPGLVTLDTIGTSEEGRNIPVLRLGREGAAYHVLLQGGIHGREHMTSWLLMALADYWSDRGLEELDICWHIIPMVNPDGVTVSQTRQLNERQQEIYREDRRQGFTKLSEGEYAAQWKANGLGLDLNRNFPAGWEQLDSRKAPSSQQYRGKTPLEGAEARALADYTQAWTFNATISFHAHGSLIYDSEHPGSHSLAKALCQATGYDLESPQGLEGGGYRDWAELELDIPSVTVEIGTYDAPLALRELYSSFARNLNLLPQIARWLRSES